VITGFVFISAVVFFAKDFAFSRVVVAIAGVISVIVVPGWRLMFHVAGRARPASAGRKSLFGRRTLIVGTGSSAQEIVRKLRTRVHDGYEVIGFIATNRREVGEQVAGLDVIGSVENVGKVIGDRRVTEVIFSTDGLSFTDILSVISRSTGRGVNFRLVPNSLEAIIGKASIDELDPIPLLEIDYNIHKAGNRMIKRIFDFTASLILLVTVYPLYALSGTWKKKPPDRNSMSSWVPLLPRVLVGKISLVGLPLHTGKGTDRIEPLSMNGQTSHLGPYGLTGLVQIQSGQRLDPDEADKLKLYYAKNQSLVLDLEILLKAVMGKKGQRHEQSSS
jgi:lipopolysaccharide/colanic/teichoic acid biosynthesis glycosyltransferase